MRAIVGGRGMHEVDAFGAPMAPEDCGDTAANIGLELLDPLPCDHRPVQFGPHDHRIADAFLAELHRAPEFVYPEQNCGSIVIWSRIGG